ncbi:MAG: adenylate/guanylate cyclase domain-containing protein [Candidatus Mcinerneyibacterium aminivorans]|uniref:Adenylate/guanylate cyclase domain-containing protein n=1 Tax=Candidatus Mcinerneyibacterium aminivorans TaxID=2703815 RepID=A0A5D0MLS4_9BACT|nr:MAG: adenylate/guanylate cyclase domain-containing protein [Candidatus Mcinerneyibacterium aminivorans]
MKNPNYFKKDLKNIFNRPFPVLPNLIEFKGIYQYRVYLGKEFRESLEQYVKHIYNDFKSYSYRWKSLRFSSKSKVNDIFDKEKRYKNNLEKILYNILKQEEDGRYLNLFFITISNLFYNHVKTIFKEDKYKYLYSGIVADFHNIIFEEVLKRFKNENSTLYDKIFRKYNFELINFIIKDQLPMFCNNADYSPETFLFSLKNKNLNSRFLISRETFSEMKKILIKSIDLLKKNKKYKKIIKYKNIQFYSNKEKNIFNYKTLVFLLRNEKVIGKLSENRVIKKEIKKNSISLQEICYMFEDIIKTIERMKYIDYINKYLHIYPIDTDYTFINTKFKNGKNFWFDGSHQIHKKIKDATILFIDIRDFTKFTNRMSPDEITKQLHLILDPLPQIINKYNGYIDKMLGDGLMAVFGGRLDDKNHMINSIRAAINIYRKFHELKNKVIFDDIGIGINTGKITITQFGQTTAIGETVNKAARLCSSDENFIDKEGFEIYRGSTQQINKKLNNISETEDIRENNFKVKLQSENSFYNRGIAISEDTFNVIRSKFSIEHIYHKNQNYYLMYDHVLSTNILIRRIGRVKLKGLGRETLYEVICDLEMLMDIKKSKGEKTIDKLKEWYDI